MNNETMETWGRSAKTKISVKLAGLHTAMESQLRGNGTHAATSSKSVGNDIS